MFAYMSESMADVKYVSHCQKLDVLLDKLEEKYGLKRSVQTTNLVQLSKVKEEEEEKLWDMAKSIKKYNGTYRTTAKLLRELQRDNRKRTRGLTTWASTTSCSSLEDFDQELKENKIEKNKRGGPVNNKGKEVSSINRQKSSNAKVLSHPEVMSSQLKKPQSRKSIQDKDTQARISRCTVSSAAKVKSKTLLLTNLPMKNCQTLREVTFVRKSINGNDIRGNITPANSALIMQPQPSLVISRSKEFTRISTPSPSKLVEPVKLVTNAKNSIITFSEKVSPHRTPSPAKVTAPSQWSKSWIKLQLEKNASKIKTNDNRKVEMLRDLLEHSKSVVMTIFNIEDESELKLQKSGIHFKSPVLAPEPKEEVNVSEIKTIFGVPYISGLSRVPRTTFLI